MGSLPKKKEKVQDIQQELQGATATFVLDYRGLSMAEMTQIRRELYKSDTRVTVAKNTLIKRAIAGTAMEAMGPVLAGPTAIAVAKGDQVAPVKVLKEYFKKSKKENVIRGGFMDGNALSEKEVSALADLPSLDELRAKLVGGIASPLTGIVMTLSGPQRSLVNVLDQLAKKKQQDQ